MNNHFIAEDAKNCPYDSHWDCEHSLDTISMEIPPIYQYIEYNFQTDVFIHAPPEWLINDQPPSD